MKDLFSTAKSVCFLVVELKLWCVLNRGDMEYFSFPENLHRSSSVSVNNEEIFPVVPSLRNATKCWDEGVTSCYWTWEMFCWLKAWYLVQFYIISTSPKRKNCHRSIIVLINVSKLSQYLADIDSSTCHHHPPHTPPPSQRVCEFAMVTKNFKYSGNNTVRNSERSV